MVTLVLPEGRSRLLRLQILTLIWMSVEAGVALAAALAARSFALGAFGGDSVVELLSAGAVLAAHTNPRLQRHADRLGGWLLLALAVLVGVGGVAALAFGAASRPSWLGMALLLAAAAVMPWLGRAKRRLARQTGNIALAADAVQSSACGYLAWIALGGLALNRAFAWPWADPLAALALVPLIAREGWKAAHGAPSCCH